MPQNLDASTLRILNADGRMVGAGFLVVPRPAVTWAHVVRAAGRWLVEVLAVACYLGGASTAARVATAGGWKRRM